MTNEELSVIAKMVAELTELKLGVTPQLDIGNFSSNLFSKLLGEYTMHTRKYINVHGPRTIDLKDL